MFMFSVHFLVTWLNIAPSKVRYILLHKAIFRDSRCIPLESLFVGFHLSQSPCQAPFSQSPMHVGACACEYNVSRDYNIIVYYKFLRYRYRVPAKSQYYCDIAISPSTNCAWTCKSVTVYYDVTSLMLKSNMNIAKSKIWTAFASIKFYYKK